MPAELFWNLSLGTLLVLFILLCLLPLLLQVVRMTGREWTAGKLEATERYMMRRLPPRPHSKSEEEYDDA